jgi:hypothetical protein
MPHIFVAKFIDTSAKKDEGTYAAAHVSGMTDSRQYINGNLSIGYARVSRAFRLLTSLRDFYLPLPLVCWFLDAGNKEAPHAQLTGVQKAPRHEVAGG